MCLPRDKDAWSRCGKLILGMRTSLKAEEEEVEELEEELEELEEEVEEEVEEELEEELEEGAFRLLDAGITFTSGLASLWFGCCGSSSSSSMQIAS